MYMAIVVDSIEWILIVYRESIILLNCYSVLSSSLLLLALSEAIMIKIRFIANSG